MTTPPLDVNGHQALLSGQASAAIRLHSDHLGSTNLTTSSTGAVVAQVRYYPYGSTRDESGATPTDYRFTGQRSEANLGLYDFNARFYDPLLGRFVSADSIVPSTANPQALNRYLYALNSPLNYIDPSGHIAENEFFEANRIADWLLKQYGVDVLIDWGYRLEGQTMRWVEGVWKLDELKTLQGGVAALADAMGGADKFRNNLQGVTVTRGAGNYGSAHNVELANVTLWNVVHEFAHAWDGAMGWRLSRELEQFTGGATTGEIELFGFILVNGSYGPGGIPAKGADQYFTRREDFAETITAFLYPRDAKAFIEDNFRGQGKYVYEYYYRMPRAAFAAEQLGVSPEALRQLMIQEAKLTMR